MDRNLKPAKLKKDQPEKSGPNKNKKEAAELSDNDVNKDKEISGQAGGNQYARPHLLFG